MAMLRIWGEPTSSVACQSAGYASRISLLATMSVSRVPAPIVKPPALASPEIPASALMSFR